MFCTWDEGPSRTYDLVFHPCPVWMRGEAQIVIPDSSNPRYCAGHLRVLFEHEGLDEIVVPDSRVNVVSHGQGLGESDDAILLMKDIRAEGFSIAPIY